MQYLLLFLVSGVSATVQTVTGFGYGIIVMALTPLFLPLEQALAISTTTSLCLNIAILSQRWRDIQYKFVWVPVLCAAAGAFAGLTLMAEHPSPVYKRILGVFLVILAVWFVWLSDRVRLRPSLASSAIVGVISGTCGGLFSINGPPMVLYYVAILNDVKQYMATTQFYFMINNINLIVMRNALGLWPTGILPGCLSALAGLLCGFFAGNFIFKRANPRRIRQAVYVVMALAGLTIALGI